MVETITPVVHGGNRNRWVVSVLVHAAGATATAAVFGSLLAAAGALLGAPWGVPGVALVACVRGPVRRPRARGRGAGAAAPQAGAGLVAHVLPAPRRRVPVRGRPRTRVPHLSRSRDARRGVGGRGGERASARRGGAAGTVRPGARSRARPRVRRALTERRCGVGRPAGAIGVAGPLAPRERGRARRGAGRHPFDDPNGRRPVGRRRARGRRAGADVRSGRDRQDRPPADVATGPRDVSAASRLRRAGRDRRAGG